MEEFSYELDPETLEIFPKYICDNSLIVFHGTVMHHNASIEAQGFQRGTSAYDIRQGLALAELLEQPGFAIFDIPISYGFLGIKTTAETLYPTILVI